MNIEDLRNFVTINELKSFSLAAVELNISQSSLSKHINALEKYLGAKLFDRTTRTIKLTPFGEKILPLCKEIINYENEILLERNSILLTTYDLKLASIPVIMSYGIPKLISDFKNSNPDVLIDFEENEDEALIQGLHNGLYDLVFVRNYEKPSSQYDFITITSDYLVASLNINHKLAKRKSISLKDLKYEPLIANRSNTRIAAFIHNLFINNGIEPNVSMRTNRLETNLDLVSQGFGSAILFNIPANYYKKEGTTIVPITPNIITDISLVRLHNKEQSVASKDFWNFIKKTVKG